jgi:hypothetical protein
MRLLLTADLHCRLPWFKWLEAQALRHEAVVISGDLLDVFHKEPLKQQVKRTTSWLRSLAAKTNVVLCSGNHDTIDIPFERGLCPMPAWVAGLASILTVPPRHRARRINRGSIRSRVLSYLLGLWTALGAGTVFEKRGWVQRMGGSIVLNTPQFYAGQELLDAPFPNHVVLDLKARQLTWYSAFQDKIDQEAFTLG